MSCVKWLTHHVDVAAAVRPGIEPSDAIAIRCLDDTDAPAFHMLRLDALREFPASFGMTYAEERAIP